FNGMTAVLGKVALAEGKGEGPRRQEVPDGMSGLKILLAEDFVDNRRMMEFYFKSTPHWVETAANGQVAVEMFQRGSYDLVLMDIQMPLLDGYAATRAIRAWEQAQGRSPVPILALTANALQSEVQRSLEAGCTAHLTKPIRKAHLLEAIHLYVQATTSSAPTPSGALAEPVVLQVSGEFESLMPEFLEHRRQELAQLKAALDRLDFETIQDIGHGLKGAGGTYGLDAISAYGRALEAAAMRGSVSGIREELDALRRFLERLQLVYV
ncbi:MAG: response regulator, partial [Nitrospira sp.]|nr:response regulator [Nitrospira sp.]